MITQAGRVGGGFQEQEWVLNNVHCEERWDLDPQEQVTHYPNPQNQLQDSPSEVIPLHPYLAISHYLIQTSGKPSPPLSLKVTVKRQAPGMACYFGPVT